MTFSYLDPAHLRLVCDDHRFLLQHGNVIALLYAYRGYAGKPYIATLQGPSGRNVLEDSPADHVHHHGVWWGHGDVNGVDFYLEVPASGRRLGRVEHRDWLKIVDDRPRWGFVEALDWRDDTGGVLLTEERSLVVAFDDPSHYTVDLTSMYTAAADLAFGDTKESVLPGIRLAEALTGVCGGKIVNSRGGVGELEVMGKEAEWIDYSGERKDVYGLRDVTEGIAILDHPTNPHHPPLFFTRTYGPVSPFQGHHFLGPATLGRGETLKVRHRLVVHAGDAQEAGVADMYERWTQEGPR